MIEVNREVREWAVIIFPLAYLALVVESFRASTFGYLRNLNPVEDVVSYIRRVSAYGPIISWSCECYHFETRTRMVTEYYTEYEMQHNYQTNQMESVAVQKSRQKEEQYQEKVITRTDSRFFFYENVTDISPQLTEEINQFQAIKIAFSKDYEPNSARARESYHDQLNAFHRVNEHYDDYYSWTENVSIQDYKQRMMSVVDVKRISVLMRWPIYVLTSLLSLSWLHRLWLEAKTANGSYRFVKSIT